MNTTQEIVESTDSFNPNHFIELGNDAGKSGNIEESVKLYLKGLAVAKQLRDTQNISKLSALIALSL